MSNVKGKKESSDEVLKDLVELSMLFDFYGELLDEHKKEIFGAYVMEDYSLSEISENVGISRQGVYDIVKRCSKQLREYEARLGLVDRFKKLNENTAKLKSLAEKAEEAGNGDLAKAIRTITEDMQKQL